MPDLSAENFDQTALLGLLRQRDPLGVLSIYVDANPGGGRRHAGAAAIDIKNRLAELARRLEYDGAHERGNALRETLRDHWPDIERLVDPRTQGRGRALYVPLSGGERLGSTNRLPLPNRVVLDESAFVHPLLELIDEGRQAGVALLSVSRGEPARVALWRAAMP